MFFDKCKISTAFTFYCTIGLETGAIISLLNHEEVVLSHLKTLCVMGTFDSQANLAIYGIKERLKNQGISIDTYEPHLTFGIYTHLDEADLSGWVRQVSANHKKLRIYFNHFGFFPDGRFCFLSPSSSFSLLKLYSDIREKFDGYCTDKGCLYSLSQKNWVPHTTLAAVEPGQEAKLLSILWEGFSPFAAELKQLKITSSDTSQDIVVFELQD